MNIPAVCHFPEYYCTMEKDMYFITYFIIRINWTLIGKLDKMFNYKSVVIHNFLISFQTARDIKINPIEEISIEFAI